MMRVPADKGLVLAASLVVGACSVPLAVHAHRLDPLAALLLPVFVVTMVVGTFQYETHFVEEMLQALCREEMA
jgi:hypothetical protein